MLFRRTSPVGVSGDCALGRIVAGKEGGFWVIDDCFDAVSRAIADAREGERAEARRAALETQLVVERQSCDALRTRVRKEARDLERLDRFSFAGALARLRGQVDEARVAEQAELAGSKLEFAARSSALTRLETEATALQRRAELLSDDRDALAAALAAREDALIAGGDSRARELAKLGDRDSHVRARVREVAESAHAADLAAVALSEAAESLSRAGGWSTYDTFFGGGFLSSLIKQDHVSDAADAIAGVHHALLRLRSELADVALPSDPLVEVPGGPLLVLDALFDNIFSDWMVDSRIRASERSVRAAQKGVADIRRRLIAHQAELDRQLGEVEGARLALLGSA